MDSLWGYIFKNDEKNKQAILTVLKSIPVFRDLSARELATIEKTLHKRLYDAGEIIFNQGVPGAGMYIIIEGEVAIIHEETGQELARLGEREFFGELALLEEAPRSATAVARTKTIVLGFFQSDLFGINERNPRLGNKIILRLARIIGERLRHSNDKLHALQEAMDTLSAYQTSVDSENQEPAPAPRQGYTDEQ